MKLLQKLTDSKGLKITRKMYLKRFILVKICKHTECRLQHYYQETSLHIFFEINSENHKFPEGKSFDLVVCYI